MSFDEKSLENNWEDFYQLLGIDRTATEEQIKKAKKYKNLLLSPDRMAGFGEETRKKAENELKKINNACDILMNRQDRENYNKLWDKKKRPETPASEQRYDDNTAKSPPKFKVYPSYIHISNVEPRKINKASFVIRNEGGIFSGKIQVNSNYSWIRIVRQYQLDPYNLFPYEVDIEIQGTEWDKKYSGEINVIIDNEMILISVDLKTSKEIFSQTFWDGEETNKNTRKADTKKDNEIKADKHQNGTPINKTYLREIDDLDEMSWILQACHMVILFGGIYMINLETQNELLVILWLIIYILLIWRLGKLGINLGFHKKTPEIDREYYEKIAQKKAVERMERAKQDLMFPIIIIIIIILLYAFIYWGR